MPGHTSAGRDDRHRECSFSKGPTRNAEDAEDAEDAEKYQFLPLWRAPTIGLLHVTFPVCTLPSSLFLRVLRGESASGLTRALQQS